MSLTLRLQKGSPLTYTELDNNFLFLTSSISSSLNTAISGSANRVAVFSSANKITGSSIIVDPVNGNTTITGNSGLDPILTVNSTSGYPAIYSETDTGTGIQVYSTSVGTGLNVYSVDGNGIFVRTTTGNAIKAEGTVQITGSLLASGSTHTLTSTTANITSTTTNLTSTALNLNSNHITASGQTSGDIDFTIAPGGAGSATINLKANTGGTSILNATGNNNTLSIKTNSIERINIDGNGTTAITGSLIASGSDHTLRGTTNIIGSTTVTGSLVASGSSHVLRGNTTITGSVNVTGSFTINTTTLNSKRYIATISQTGTDIPEPDFVYKNDFTSPITFGRTGAGTYTVSCTQFTGGIVIGQFGTYLDTDAAIGKAYYDYLANGATGGQQFYSYNSSNVKTDGVLTSHLLILEVFY